MALIMVDQMEASLVARKAAAMAVHYLVVMKVASLVDKLVESKAVALAAMMDIGTVALKVKLLASV